jgi:hypothetical protein
MTCPKITLYEVAEDRVTLLDKPFPEASLWWGHTDTAHGLLYLPERSRPCLIVWDVEEEAGEVFSYPEAGVLPSVSETGWPARLEVFTAPGEERPRRVYFDPEVRRFVAEDQEEFPPLRPGTGGERYIVSYNDGRMVRLDRKTGERYERAVPGWGETLAFIGGGVFYEGWQLNNLGTGYSKHYRYNRRTNAFTPLKEEELNSGEFQEGEVRRALETVDGHPHHFMDRFLAYHPESDTFDFLVPDVPKDRYPQLCYNHVMDNELYITANDIFSKEKGRALGAIENPVGQVMVLQSHPVNTGRTEEK